ncbi:MauE/DoxX family redox-associated membrane protein [Sphaerisporangium aureirubrum]|uniref:MauE/DoxX family redox-associated membrane protein n=1 Tax=Sphaerisporangium aureirubrum TaxID=1544736 RepID=A0ABW1NWI5_9ACTN
MIAQTMLATVALELLVLMLLLGGVAKFATAGGHGQPGNLSRLGPGVLIPDRWRRPFMIFCAGGEVTLAVGLLFTGNPLPRWGTIAFFAVATYVLWELRRRRPDVGCGCFGEASSAPVGLRSIARAAVLVGLAVVVALVPVSGADIVSGMSAGLVVATLAGAAVLVLLSPEMGEGIARVRHRAPCEQRPMPAGRALHRLRASGEWRAHAPLLLSGEPSDSWRELCWRFFVYPGRTAEGAPAEVVFAVYLTGRRAPVRVGVMEVEGEGLRESIEVSAVH